MGSSVRFGVLGPLVAEDAHGPVELKGPRHRAVLARLLLARGRVVPVDRLVDDLWDDPPDGAIGAIQTFVSALRRALEPHRPPRAPARLLVTAAPGYALHTAPDSVDAWRFETAVAEAGRLLAAHQPAPALTLVEEALGWWRGPAYAEFADQPWARAEISRLDELRLLAGERRSSALLALDRPAEAAPDLEAQVNAHPWREDGWRLLALAHYRAGRQGDALDTLRRARATLADDLGIDPGPDLRQLETDILTQAAHLTVAQPETATNPLFGRTSEQHQLAEVAAEARRGRLRLVLVSGDAGVGKTALAEAATRQLAGQGWRTAWGGNPEAEGLPPAWPWTQLLDALAATGHGEAPTPEPSGDPVVARFHWHRAVGGYLARAARRQPLLLVVDDLHWAGAETVALLAALVGEPVAAPILVVATYRTTDVPAHLAEFLGRAARAEPSRIYLGGLDTAAATELVRATIGRDVDTATAGAIQRRSGGNPFFVRELARLFDAEGAAGLAAVPAGVRDVVRYRVARLPETAQIVLRQAAVIGTEIELPLLNALHDEPLDAVECAVRRGFLVEHGAGRFRFTHALVRDTLYQDISQSRRAHWHRVIAETLEAQRPGEVTALAHHFLLAEDPRTARYARAAAELAEQRFAPHEAARLWQAALDHTHDVRGRLTALTGLARALAIVGDLGPAREHRAAALELAEPLGEPTLTAQVIGAFDVPAIWTDHDDPALAQRIAAAAERTLATLPPQHRRDRARLLATLALELRNTGGDRARAAAREAEAIARELDDPTLLAFALNARFMQCFDRAGLAVRRAEIGAELVTLAGRHNLVTFEVLGHLILVQAHSALAEFTVADAHAAAADRLGADYQIPLISVFTDWYRALRRSVLGPFREAEAAYRAEAARLPGTGMSGLDNGILALALHCHRIHHGLALDAAADFGAYAPWCQPSVTIPSSPHDLLFEARTCLHARIAIQRGDRPAMAECYAALLPAEHELAGAGSGLLTLGPVAHHLADLAAALDHPDRAAAHRRAAEKIEATLDSQRRTVQEPGDR